MSANPITLIVLAIVALVAAVIYAYKRWGWFRNVVQAAWRLRQGRPGRRQGRRARIRAGWRRRLVQGRGEHAGGRRQVR
ncbi:hypothetical protein KBZ21_40580, partial [Streptomyces sp. A73]|nr:hypothetical protein [Streptomyces sp. A73]